jgi:hypothetical protein
MAANSEIYTLLASARVVGNATTPPNGFIQGEGITSITRTGAGVYNVQVAPDFSLQEMDVVAQLQGAAAGMASVAKIGAGHYQVSTFDGAGAAADRDFSLKIFRYRVGG